MGVWARQGGREGARGLLSLHRVADAVLDPSCARSSEGSSTPRARGDSAAGQLPRAHGEAEISRGLERGSFQLQRRVSPWGPCCGAPRGMGQTGEMIKKCGGRGAGYRKTVETSSDPFWFFSLGPKGKLFLTEYLKSNPI